MSADVITFDPALCVPAEPRPASYGPIKGVLWLVFLLIGIASVIGNVFIRFVYLPHATSQDYHQIAVLGFALHMVGPLFAAGAIALAPRIKILQGFTVLMLAINVAFTFFLIFTGIFTITHIR